MNFRVSRDKPNPSKPLSWHKTYYQTRMLMVEALRDVNPRLYHLASQTKDEGLVKIQAMQTAMTNAGHDAR